MRDAVEAAFGPLELVDTGDAKRHWRLRSDALRRIVAVSSDGARGARLWRSRPLSVPASRSGQRRSGILRRSFVRPCVPNRSRGSRPTSRRSSRPRVLPCAQARGLGSRRGCFRSSGRRSQPAARWSSGISPRTTGQRSRQRVRPLGLLYGNRAFLVASNDWSEEPRLWRLANVSELRLTDESLRAGSVSSIWSGMRSVRSGRSRKKPSRWSSDSTPAWPGTRRLSFSIRTRPLSNMTMGRSRCASRLAASTRCAGTSSHGGKASPSSNRLDFVDVSPSCASAWQRITE